MKKKLPPLLAVCLLAFAGSAQALSIDELIAIGTMPLAVAEVAAIPEVPREELIAVVTTLNQAAVPAPQFIEVVRYAPLALVGAAEPRFVTYVQTEYERGVVGEPLAVAIANQYQTYGIPDVDVVDPPVVTVIEQRQILPPVVVTRFQPVEFDPLALVAMPLAVAAVSDLIGVPRNDLINFVTSLNRAMVPAPQFVEVVRYSPVVLVDSTASPQFLQFVTNEIDRGLFGRPLAFAIADRLQTVEQVDLDLVDPVFVVDRDEILPPVVVTQFASRHPHGGPPGQLKKQLGLKTGAEVVHGTSPRPVTAARTSRVRSVDRDDDRVTTRRSRPQRVETAPKVRVEKPRVVKPQRVPDAQPRVKPDRGPKHPPSGGQGQGHGGGHGNAGSGKGKGKGKG